MRTVRLRLDIAYDGSGFSGWARQPDRRTVQGTIEEALGRVLRLADPPAVTVAGRTDARVHARGQVAHVDVPEEAWTAAAVRSCGRLAAMLPADVRVWDVAEAPSGFDARFSAVARRYVYRVSDRPTGVDPLRRHDTLWHPQRLDPRRMNEAARHLLGEHDFAAFCRRREGATTVRQLLTLRGERTGTDGASTRHDDGALALTIEADAFCHNMVRAVVGALLPVGDGRRPPTWPGELLAAGVRDPAVQVVPPHGLCLEQVRYPPDADLAARADETRRLRTLPAPRPS